MEEVSRVVVTDPDPTDAVREAMTLAIAGVLIALSVFVASRN